MIPPVLARVAAGVAATLVIATPARSADFALPPSGGYFQQVAANQPTFGNVWTGIGQSFVAVAQQMRFGFYALDTDASADSVLFRLIEGDGLGGTVLAQRSVTLAAGPAYRRSLMEADFSAVNLTEGSHYTVMASLPGQGLPAIDTSTSIGFEYAQTGANPGLYPDGRFYYSGSAYDLAFGGRDLAFSITAVPEPGTLVMASLGLAAMGLWRRRQSAIAGQPLSACG